MQVLYFPPDSGSLSARTVSCRTGGVGRRAVSVPLGAILADVGQRTPQTGRPARPLPGLVDSGPRSHTNHTGQDTQDLRRRCAGDAAPRARPHWSRDPHDPDVALAWETRRECQGMAMEGMIGPRPPPVVRHGHEVFTNQWRVISPGSSIVCGPRRKKRRGGEEVPRSFAGLLLALPSGLSPVSGASFVRFCSDACNPVASA